MSIRGGYWGGWGWGPEGPGAYADYQRLFEEALPSDVRVFGEYHALLVALGKDVCRKNPLCHGCVLKQVCEYGREEVISSKVTSYREPKSGYHSPHQGYDFTCFSGVPLLSL